MEKINSFKDLMAWQEGHKLVLIIYEITKFFPRDEMFGLTSQMRRAAVSITSNVAEGFTRQSYKEKLQFYAIANGSATELQNQLEVSKDVGYLSKEKYDTVYALSIKIHKIINGLIKGCRLRIFPSLTHHSLFIILFLTSLFLIPNSTFAATIGKPPNFLTINTGLVGHWTFDGPKMLTNVADSSGQGNIGYLSHGGSGTTTVPGKLGQAFNFDGSNDYVNFGSNAILNPGTTNNSISVWIKFTTIATQDYQAICGKGFLDSVVGYGLFVGSESRPDLPNLVIYQFRNGATIGSAVSNVELNDNKWHHIVGIAIRDSTTGIRLYVDGNLQTITASSVPFNGVDITTARKFECGARDGGASTGFYYRGSIDDVRIYNRALTAGEITQLYNIGAASKVASTPKGLPGQGLNSGLVGWWTMDGKDTPWTSATAATTLDKSGNGNTGTLTNMAQGTSPVAGKIGQALSFDGADDYVNIGDPASGILDFGTNSFSVAFWMKASVIGFPLAKRVDSGTNGYDFLFNTNGTLQFRISGSSSNSSLSGNLNDNKWHHIIGVINRSDQTLRFYVDNVKIGADVDITAIGSLSNTSLLQFGSRASAGGFGGSLDDVRIYNRALTAGEITQLYNIGAASKVASTPKGLPGQGLNSGLVGWWTFDGPKMLTNVADSSGQGNIGYLSHGGSGTTTAAGKLGQGLDFDGVNDCVRTGTISLPLSAKNTVSFWIKSPNSAWAGQRFITWTNTTDGTNNQLWIRGQPTVIQYGLTLGGGYSTASYTHNGSTNWFHVVLTWNDASGGDSSRFYINGVDVGGDNSAIGTVAGSATGSIDIGSNNGCSGNFWNGSLDDVRIWNRALSAGEIKQLYNMGR